MTGVFGGLVVQGGEEVAGSGVRGGDDGLLAEGVDAGHRSESPDDGRDRFVDGQIVGAETTPRVQDPVEGFSRGVGGLG